MLPDFNFRQVKFDLPEIQGEPEEIVTNKLKYALSLQEVTTPIVIEDTCLGFNALKGLPGPYIKFFLQKLGNQGLFEMVKHYDDHSGFSQTIFGMAKSKEEDPKLFVGRNPGTIVEPRGDERFGWDPVFQPDGYDQTFAEMDSTDKNSMSQRYLSLEKLANWVKNNPDYFN